jgi:hypothetical protein
VALTAAAVTVHAETKSDYDKEYDFAKLKTFDFKQQAQPAARAWLSAYDTPGDTGVAMADSLHAEIALDELGAERLVSELVGRGAFYQRLGQAELHALAQKLPDAGTILLDSRRYPLVLKPR